MTFQFEKLLVYQKSLDFADEVCTATEQFSRGYGFLVDKLTALLSRSPLTSPKATAALPKPIGRISS